MPDHAYTSAAAATATAAATILKMSNNRAKSCNRRGAIPVRRVVRGMIRCRRVVVVVVVLVDMMLMMAVCFFYCFIALKTHTNTHKRYTTRV